MTRRGENIAIHFRNFSPSLQRYKEIFYGGSPSMMRQGLACIATMSLNLAAGVYGDSAIAAMSIVGRIAMLSFAVVIGLGQGFQPVCGFCYGAGLYDRLKEAYKFTVTIGVNALILASNMLAQTCRKPWRANILAAAPAGFLFFCVCAGKVVLFPSPAASRGVRTFWRQPDKVCSLFR